MKNARYVAEFLADHPKVKKVHYLGFLPTDPAARDLRGAVQGAGLDLLVRGAGGEAEAFRLLNALRLIGSR